MRWCISQEPKVDPLAYDTKNILRFFMDHQLYSIQQLLLFFFRALYPHLPPIAGNVIIQDFF
ncbi:hypothetical protein AB4K20DRAFT_1876989 [Rhizopus microsporus]